MAARKAVMGGATQHPELDRLIAEARKMPITDEQLREQRVSFAYGNAPAASRITKDSVRTASQTLRLAPRG